MDKEFQIVGLRKRILHELLTILVLQNRGLYWSDRLVEFHNGEPDYYLKRGYKSYRAEDYGDTNT